LSTLNFYRFDNLSLGLSQFSKLEKEERNRFFSQLLKDGKKRVDFFGYSLMPNHFHFLFRQLTDNGIAKFMGDFSNSYTRYFNIKHERIGHLFQGVFKAVRVESDEQFIHVWRYIQINPVVSLVIKEAELENYPYSSFAEYLSEETGVCNKKPILDYFPSIKELKNFVYDRIDYGKKLEVIKHLVWE
jgi:putative transposase